MRRVNTPPHKACTPAPHLRIFVHTSTPMLVCLSTHIVHMYALDNHTIFVRPMGGGGLFTTSKVPAMLKGQCNVV